MVFGRSMLTNISTILFLLLVCSGFAMPQRTDSASNAPLPAKPVFRAVDGAFGAITVPDLDASANWYAEKLGLRVVKNHVLRADYKAAVTILQGNGFAVELIWLDDSVPLSSIDPKLKGPQNVHGLLKAGLFVNDLDDTLSALKSRNVTMAFQMFYDKSMDCRTFAIRDNNGNILQFFGK
jgi:catechol 2,3-dioxygenase-like lactoylglutathione lyase family enzyme